MTTQRTKLETRRDALLRMLESKETQGRGRIVNELRGIVDELRELDAGTHWTQPPSETLKNIVIGNLPTEKRMTQ